MSALRAAPSWVASARDLILVAMAVFAVNIAIGILNGADVVEFTRDQLLTHVHAGTVGWLTLTIVASAFLLFRASDRRLVIALAVLVPIYVVAFFTGNLAFRAIGGTALLIAIAWLLVWVWREYLGGERSLPKLAVALGLTAFGYGAVVGVLLQISFAAGVTIIPGDAIGAHASAMTFSYLVLAAMGLMEWRLLGTRDLPRAGLVQVVALFLGGLIISVALLAGAEQAGGGLYLLTQLVAVVLFVVRIWPRSLRIDWLAASPIRNVAAASLWVVIALALFIGGIVISVGLMVGAEQAAGGLYLLLELVAVVLFVIRIWPRSTRVGWLDANPIRHVAAASIWVVGALILFMYLVFSFITAADPSDPAAFPVNVLLASDHAVYIGVITNIVLSLLAVLVLDESARRSWIGHLMFWGVNLGLLVFVVGLILNTPEIKRIGAPVMGLTLYVSLAILAWRAISASIDSVEAGLAEPA